MLQAESRLIEEHQRVAHYLNASTEPKLRAIAEQELVQTHTTTLVEVGAFLTTRSTSLVHVSMQGRV
jgi:hypothetical protein